MLMAWEPGGPAIFRSRPLSLCTGLLIAACDSAPVGPVDGAGSLTVRLATAEIRQGTVTSVETTLVDADGRVVRGLDVTWEVQPAGAGLIEGGKFVAYTPGIVRLRAQAGTLADTTDVVVLPRGVQGSLTKAGEGVETGRYTTDLWLHGDYAYTGTRSPRSIDADRASGDRLFVWDVRDPSNPTKVYEVALDARVVNDVKIRADGALAVVTHEGSDDGLNGITILDTTDPARPAPVARFTEGLERGVHNTWVEGDHVYAAVDGDVGLRVIDIVDPSSPRAHSGFVVEGHRVHDVYVRNGLAFVSHWDAGLAIVDVGNGIAGGSPAAPQLVSRLLDLGGQTHNAWYWPDAGYVFVGEEDFGRPGFVHVVDVRDLGSPNEVGSFQVAGQPPHNFWVDEARGVLYAAWYGEGLRAVDVTGELLGALDRQGREVAGLRYNGGSGVCDRAAGTATCTWAPQLHRGLVWVSDINRGIVALEMEGGPGGPAAFSGDRASAGEVARD